MKYKVVILPVIAMDSPAALAKWLNDYTKKHGFSLVTVDGRNYIFESKEI